MNIAWHHPPFEPLDLPPGSYEIRIGVSAQGGESCCIFELFEPTSKTAVHESAALFSGQGSSTEWRACYAGIAGGLERLPKGSHALIVCSQVEVMKMVERIDQLTRDGWLTTERRPIANVEIVQRIKHARDGEDAGKASRLKEVSCNFRPSLEQRIAIDRLQKLAAEALRKKRNS